MVLKSWKLGTVLLVMAIVVLVIPLTGILLLVLLAMGIPVLVVLVLIKRYADVTFL